MAIAPLHEQDKRTTEFVDFVYRHYETDPGWIPPLRSDEVALHMDSASMHESGNGERRHFLALSRGLVRGRITAFFNPELTEQDGEPVGSIGNFECVEDYGVAEDLFNHAIEWLRCRYNVRHVWGPLNHDIWHGYRWMTDGFHHPRILGEPYNKSFYPEFAERFGFSPRKSWESVDVKGYEDLDRMTGSYSRCYERFLARGYRFEAVTRHNYKRSLPRLHQLLSESYAEYPGFTPITFTRFEQLYEGLRYALRDGLFVTVHDAGGCLAGFSGAFLDLSNAMRSLAGRVTPLGMVRFLRHLRRTNHVLYYAIGASRKVMSRSLGFGLAVSFHFVKALRKLGYDSVTIGPMPTDGISRRLARGDAFPAQRRYVLYEIQTD